MKNEEINVKTTVFDVPGEVWRSGFDSVSMGSGSSNRIVTFKEFNLKFDNTEFVRDLNLLTA